MKIIHRDLKFQNILLAKKPDIAAVKESSPTKISKYFNEFDLDLKIVDFGIFGASSITNPEKSHAGSLKYMAPEILKGHTESTPKLDVWSLGIILFGLLVGYLPFRSKDKEDLKR